MAGKGLFCGTNRPETDAELKQLAGEHQPIIDCPDEVRADEPFDVSIRVGQPTHPMQKDHHIQWVEVHAGSNFHCRLDLTPEMTLPVVTVRLVFGPHHAKHKLKVQARCNQHGQWLSSKYIAVTK